jgi:anti-sigma B factor antagonist
MERQWRAAPAGAALAVVELPAELDAANAGQVDQDVTAALLSGATTVIVDMSATTFCDSSCVRSLARAHNRAAAQDIDLRFVIAGRGVLRILQITGLDSLLRIFPSLEAARMAAPVTKGEAPIRLPGRLCPQFRPVMAPGVRSD